MKCNENKWAVRGNKGINCAKMYQVLQDHIDHGNGMFKERLNVVSSKNGNGWSGVLDSNGREISVTPGTFPKT